MFFSSCIHEPQREKLYLLTYAIHVSRYVFGRFGLYLYLFSGPFTVLAPTDAAFSKVDLATMTSLANNPSQLKKVLEYHVIPEFVLAPQVNGNVTKTTVSGQDVLITGARGMVSYTRKFLSGKIKDIKNIRVYVIL